MSTIWHNLIALSSYLLSFHWDTVLHSSNEGNCSLRLPITKRSFCSFSIWPPVQRAPPHRARRTCLCTSRTLTDSVWCFRRSFTFFSWKFPFTFRISDCKLRFRFRERTLCFWVSSVIAINDCFWKILLCSNWEKWCRYAKDSYFSFLCGRTLRFPFRKPKCAFRCWNSKCSFNSL